MMFPNRSIWVKALSIFSKEITESHLVWVNFAFIKNDFLIRSYSKYIANLEEMGDYKKASFSLKMPLKNA